MARKGLPKSIIKKYGISKKAWSVFRGRRTKSRPRSRVSNPKRRVKRTARKKKRRGGGRNIQATIFKWLRVGALVGPGVVAATKGGTWEEKASYVLAKYTSYESWNNRFNAAQLVEGYAPFLAATLATYGIPKIAGIIRRL
jgi:hypothetical protein